MKSKKIVLFSLALFAVAAMRAQQLPDPHFENWSEVYNKDAQLKDWHGSNVTQVGLKFTFMYQKQGRTGSCAYVADREIGAIGITAVGPGYMSLGQPWQYMKGLTIRSASAGTEGGIAWTHRPDTMAVCKRLGVDYRYLPARQREWQEKLRRQREQQKEL